MKIEIVEFRKENKEILLQMMKEFYQSEALEHHLSNQTITKILDDILSKKYNAKGYEFVLNEKIVGFGIVTFYYQTEISGMTLQFEDIFVREEFRNQGVAKDYIRFVMNNNKEISRFRLEVVEDNLVAVKLYEKLGFEKLNYHQMVIDK